MFIKRTTGASYACFAGTTEYMYLLEPYAVGDLVYSKGGTLNAGLATSVSELEVVDVSDGIYSINEDGTVTIGRKLEGATYSPYPAGNLTDVSDKYYAFIRKSLAIAANTYDPDFTVVGSPTVTANDTGDLSVYAGWNSSNYIVLNEAFAPGSNSWEFGIKVKNPCRFLGSTGRQWLSVIGIDDSRKMYLIRGNGSTNLIVQAGNTAFPADTWVWVRFSYDGNGTYKFEYSYDGETYTVDKTFTSSTTMESMQQFGVHWDSGSGFQYKSGSVDMKEAYIKINGNLWWSNKYWDNVYDYKTYVPVHAGKYY